MFISLCLQILTGVHLPGQDVHRHFVSLWGVDHQSFLNRQTSMTHVGCQRTSAPEPIPPLIEWLPQKKKLNTVRMAVWVSPLSVWSVVTALWRFSYTVGPHHCRWMEDYISLKIWLVCSQTASTVATKYKIIIIKRKQQLVRLLLIWH